MELGSPMYFGVLVFHGGGYSWIKWRRFNMTPDMALWILVLGFWGLVFWLGYKHGQGDTLYKIEQRKIEDEKD